MRLRIVVAIAVAVALAGSVGVAQKRAYTGKYTVSEVGRDLGSCGSFHVLADWVMLVSWMYREDKSGQWAADVDHYRVLGQTLYYNSTDPDKSIAGGPGEVENDRYFPATGVIDASGLVWKVKVPGYGLIWAETGQVVLQCEPQTFANCQVVFNSGHNQFWDEDLAALCNYLQ